jgi:hypothetical protein
MREADQANALRRSNLGVKRGWHDSLDRQPTEDSRSTRTRNEVDRVGAKRLRRDSGSGSGPILWISDSILKIMAQDKKIQNAAFRMEWELRLKRGGTVSDGENLL